MTKYAAFLRGVNTGKNLRVKMEVLREAFEKMGFENVRTVIASGNVIFEAPSADVAELEQKIERSLPGKLGFNSNAFIITIESLRKLTTKNPFDGIELTSREKPYVTFVKGDAGGESEFPIKGKGFTILGIHDGVVCSVVDLSKGGTPDLMLEINKIWKINTTRGLKTIERILG